MSGDRKALAPRDPDDGKHQRDGERAPPDGLSVDVATQAPQTEHHGRQNEPPERDNLPFSLTRQACEMIVASSGCPRSTRCMPL